MKDQLQPGEEILFVARPSKVPLVPLGALVAAAVIGAVVAFYFERYPLTLAACALAVIALVWLLARIFMLNSNKYVLTNRRVVRQRGILTRNSVDSYLDKVNNVEHRQTLWGRMLGYGDVEIDTASETGMTRFPMICDPLEFKNAVIGAMEQYRSTRFGGAVAPPPVSGAEKIRQLKALLDDGLISAEEFEAKRKELLAGM